MSCYTCKSKTNEVGSEPIKTNLFARLFYFLISCIVVICVLPFIALAGFYLLFKSIVLDEATNILPSLTIAANLIKKVSSKNDEDDDEDNDEDDEEFDQDDYELIDVEVIETKNG